jgi:hypothetical protein
VPTDELDRRLAALAEAAQEHADAPAPAVIRARARWRRARNAAAAAMAVAAAAALLAVIRPALVRDSKVAGPSPSVSTSPGVVPWVREPARRRAPTPTSPGARPADLAVSIAAPRRAVLGQPLRYTVTITNAGGASLPLRPCPNYDQRLAVEGARPVLQPWRLNCQPVAAIGPGERVSFAMQLDVPADLPPGRAVLLWNLDLGPGAQLKPIQLVRP